MSPRFSEDVFPAFQLESKPSEKRHDGGKVIDLCK